MESGKERRMKGMGMETGRWLEKGGMLHRLEREGCEEERHKREKGKRQVIRLLNERTSDITKVK